MTAFERTFRCALLTVLLALAAARRRPARGPRVQGAGVHEGGGRVARRRPPRASTALKALGKERRLRGHDDRRTRRAFTDDGPRAATAPSCSSTRPATSSATRSRPRSRTTTRTAAASSAIGSAIETEPRLGVPDRPARHARRRRAPSRPTQATIKVADRGHDAEQGAAGVLDAHATASTTSTANVRGVSHVLATVDERPTPAAR